MNKRLSKNTRELNAIVIKSNEAFHNGIKAIEASQQFMSDKFDQILTDITQFKVENVQLKRKVNELNPKGSKLEFIWNIILIRPCFVSIIII